MLTSTEIVQALRRTVDLDQVTVEVDTEQTVIPLGITVAIPRGPMSARLRDTATKQATTTVDSPVITVRCGSRWPVTICLDRLDPDAPRWVATLPGASQMVVKGAGDVDRLVAEAELPTRTGGHAA